MTTLTYDEQLRHVVRTAGLAPSVHNTQPWRFALLPDGLELRADPTKGLQVLDLDGRQLHLSCGAALYHARVAARALGLNARIRLLPDESAPTVLARLVLAPGPPASQEEIDLATAILHRHTFRGVFEPTPVPEPLIAAIRQAAESEGAVLRQVSTESDIIELAVLLDHADRDEERDSHYRQELAGWLRSDPNAADGIPLGATDATSAGSQVRQRDFTLHRPDRGNGSTPVAEHPLLLVLGTGSDDPESWLRAGQALAAVLLVAARDDVQAQPLGQVTDTMGYRRRLQLALSMIATPQLVLRMGRTTRAKALTPRRDLEDVLVPVGG
ncbi:MAG: hypothetical protein JWM40_183 [Frankiales bacterium]|nr:hypothetical protein [Frankiales bacterium]